VRVRKKLKLNRKRNRGHGKRTRLADDIPQSTLLFNRYNSRSVCAKGYGTSKKNHCAAISDTTLVFFGEQKMKNKQVMMVSTILILNFLLVDVSRAQGTSVCGEAPPVANESLKGDIQGKAQLLTRYLGEAQLSGKIETSRTEIFSKYPDAELSRSNAYFEYQVCILIMTDSTKSASKKLEALKEVRREFNKPVKVNIIIQRGNLAIYDNKEWGPVDGSLSFVELKIDDESVVENNLHDKFGSHKLQLSIGEHTFEFVAMIFGAGENGAIFRDTCQGTFDVTESGVFNPRVKFVRSGFNNSGGRIASCSLKPDM
jgi:hypothetical protein